MSNFFILEGNLTREPETNLVNSKTVIKFSIAESVRNKDQSGNWVDGEPNYYNINYWTEKPDYWLKRLGKGTGVVVRGIMKQDRREKDGQKFSNINFTATEITGRWLPELSNAPQGAPQGAPAQTQTPVSAPVQQSEPEDIPF